MDVSPCRTLPLASAEGLRIALFSGNYNYLKEGANNALNHLVAHLLDRGATVRVYSPTSSTPAFEPAGELVSVPSIPLPIRSEFRIALGMPGKVRRDVARFAPNIVHVSTPDFLGSAAIRMARKINVPVVASLHTLFETYLEHYGLAGLRNWAWARQKEYYAAADLVFAPSVPMVARLKAMGIPQERVRIWGRGIDHEIFTPKLRDDAWRAGKGFASDETVICYFGRVVREKGLACFADTIAQLRQRGHTVRPLVIGQGPGLGEFRRMIGPSVFTGHLDGKELGRALASADVLLNPSTTEAFGNVNQEAMAAGLAVVSVDVPNARAIMEDGKSGLLCALDPAAFADAIEGLLQRPFSRFDIGLAASMAASYASWPAANDAAVRSYRELLMAGDQVFYDY